MGHSAVDALYAAIGAGMVRTDADLVDAKAFVDGAVVCLGKLSPVARDEGDEALPLRDVLVDKDVGSAVNWAASTACMSAQRLKRSVKRRM